MFNRINSYPIHLHKDAGLFLIIAIFKLSAIVIARTKSRKVHITGLGIFGTFGICTVLILVTFESFLVSLKAKNDT